MPKKAFFFKILKNKFVLNIIKFVAISGLLFFFYYNQNISLEKGDFYTKKESDFIVIKTGKKSDFSFLDEKNGDERLSSLQNITGKLIISPNKNGYKIWEGWIETHLQSLPETGRKTNRYSKQTGSLQKTGLASLSSQERGWGGGLFFHGRLYQRTYKNSQKFIKKLGENGAAVKIILEDKKYKQYRNDFKNLQKYFGDNVELKNDHKLGVNYTHAKTFVSNNFTIIQTANLSHTSFVKNIEHFFWTENKDIQKNMEKLWQKDWNGENITKKDINPNLLFCPIDCREKIEFFLKNAKKSLFGYQQYIYDENIQKILSKKISNNVKVQIKLPDNDGNRLLQKKLGSQSIVLLKEPYIHSKTFLIDDKYLILGSMNMSSNSLDNNREIGIIITDREIIDKWKAGFKK